MDRRVTMTGPVGAPHLEEIAAEPQLTLGAAAVDGGPVGAWVRRAAAGAAARNPLVRRWRSSLAGFACFPARYRRPLRLSLPGGAGRGPAR